MHNSERCYKSLKRPKPFRDISYLHWVFCEGETEEDCLNTLRKHWHLPSTHIKCIGNSGTPWTIVKKAKEKRDELRRQRQKGFMIHVVFDKDSHPRFLEAIHRANALHFNIGISVPCFEIWGILLYKYHSAQITRQKAQSLLKKLDKYYDHNKYPYLDEDKVVECYDMARERAEKLNRLALDIGDEYKNPTTTFSDVVSAIKQR